MEKLTDEFVQRLFENQQQQQPPLTLCHSGNQWLIREENGNVLEWKTKACI